MKIRLWDSSIVNTAFSFAVNPDSCSNPDFFHYYIRFSAISDQSSGRGVTHAILSDDEQTLLGFVTLKNTALLTSAGHGEPALEIANLAVSKDYERQGIGRTLLNYSISVSEKINSHLSGVRFLVLAADPKSVDFYEHMKCYKFQEYWTLPRETTNESWVPMFMQLHI